MLQVILAFLDVIIFLFKVIIIGILIVAAILGFLCIKEQIVEIWALHKTEVAKNKKNDDLFDDWIEDYRNYRNTYAPHELPELEPATPRR